MAPVETDAGKLKQVLINLVGNALKFTEEGSVRVTLRVDPETHRPIRIDVADTGIGVPRDRLSAIFGAFEQAESGTTRKYGGTGLGLAICSSLAQLLGFRLEVESEPGTGSVFSVVFSPAGEGVAAPVAAGESGAAEALLPAALAEREPMEEKLVLVIDDETDSRMLLTHYIEELGCKVIAASSGDQGLRMAREFRPDLITLDLLLPDMSGWDILRSLKADPELCHVPVVVVSVIAEDNRGSVLGAVELLDKPIERDALLAIVERHLTPAAGRVLIVDDEPDARLLLATYLRDAGAEIRLAESGRAALRLLETFEPDLVVLDLLMPEMDGREVLRALQSTPAARRAPVVIVTAKDLSPAEVRQLNEEAEAVLQKDGDLEQELRAVLDHLRTRKAAPRLAVAVAAL